MRREAGLTLFFSPPHSGGEAASAGTGDVAAGDVRTGSSTAAAPGRPDATAIAALAGSSGKAVPFSISHQPSLHPYWLELLALGLTFDMRGLAPGIAAQVASPAYAFGLPADQACGLEAVVVRPGPHLAAAGALLPVVRTLAALGCELAALPGLVGIGWEPADTIMAPAYFRQTVGAWLDGGAFPSLGLTALDRSGDGTMRTVGLGFLVGHEFELTARAGESPAAAARLAVRLIHDLVQNGPYTPGDREGPGGEILHCTFNADMTVLRVRQE